MTAAFGSDEAPRPRPLLMLSMLVDDADVNRESGGARVVRFEVEYRGRVKNCLDC
jgi:hypothetical protein